MKQMLWLTVIITNKNQLTKKFLATIRLEYIYWRYFSSTMFAQNTLKEKFVKDIKISEQKDIFDSKDDMKLNNSEIQHKAEMNDFNSSKENKNLPIKIRFKQAVKDYGSTVIIFHTIISLSSLGLSYLAVSSGIDLVWLLTKLGASESFIASSFATGASTFVMAYALHKVFAPARILCTLTCVPLIVRKLRKIGFIKMPISK